MNKNKIQIPDECVEILNKNGFYQHNRNKKYLFDKFDYPITYYVDFRDGLMNPKYYGYDDKERIENIYEYDIINKMKEELQNIKIGFNNDGLW